MPPLTAAEYDRLEQAALIAAPVPIVECTRPVTFNTTGFPSRIQDTRALGKFVEVFQDLRFDRHLNTLGGGVTAAEFDLIRTVCGIVARLSAEQFGETRVPTSSLLSSLIGYRQVRALHPDPGTLVLEIGPGNGYLGALLALSGYSHVCTEVTPALYLYQNNLYARIAEESAATFVELAGDDRTLSSMSDVAPGTLVHVPWWKFYVPRPGFSIPCGCIAAHQVLGEMHPRAFRYVAHLAGQLLNRPADPNARNPGLRSFLSDGWGWSNPAGNAGEQILSALIGEGLLPFESSAGLVFLPAVHKSGNDDRATATEMLGAAERATKSAIAVRADDLKGYLRNLLGRDDLLTEGEHFLLYAREDPSRYFDAD